MAYRRFVTYLFRYKNGRKEENCGFAKVEVRQNRARMEIQVRGVPDGTDRVYLFAQAGGAKERDSAGENVVLAEGAQWTEKALDKAGREEWKRPAGSLVGAYMGTLTVRDGAGRERFVFDAEPVGGTPYGMEEMAGIYIKSAGGFLASQWVDAELDWGSFREYAPPKRSMPEEETEKTEADDVESEEAAKNASDQLPVFPSELQATQTASAAVRVEIPAGQTRAAVSGNLQDARQMFEKQPQKTRVSSYMNAWERQWQKFTEMHPLFCPFDEAPEILAVKMDLRDFKLLPKAYLPLANNSFLLHGYFNYKYLLFGYMDGEPRRWFLGVPGVFQNQEQLLAGLFGFGEFRTRHLTKQKTGEFGYWYRYLEW